MLGSKNGSSVSRLKADPRGAVKIVHFENKAGILLHFGLQGRASRPSRQASHFISRIGRREPCQDSDFPPKIKLWYRLRLS